MLGIISYYATICVRVLLGVSSWTGRIYGGVLELDGGYSGQFSLRMSGFAAGLSSVSLRLTLPPQRELRPLKNAMFSREDMAF